MTERRKKVKRQICIINTSRSLFALYNYDYDSSSYLLTTVCTQLKEEV